MCGIVGFSSPQRFNHAETILNNMLKPLTHRGPDQHGIVINQNFAFGHVRLGIINLKGGRQPCTDSSKVNPTTLIFNGEIYDFQTLASQLRKQGVILRDESDTEVLYWLLNTQGIEKTLDTIDGMFAFAYHSPVSQQLFLARDRFGEKPLFYAVINDAIVFASEISAIQRHPLCNKLQLDLNQISQYLCLEYLPGQATGFKGIHKLLPGHYLSYRNGKITQHQYWQPEFSTTGTGKFDGIKQQEAIQSLDDILTDSVRQRLVADVPVGVFLSGGLDSSLIAAFVAKQTSALSCYTIKMPDASFDETHYARKVAQHIGLPIEVIELDQQSLLNTLDILDTQLDEPFADSSLIPTYLLCKAAKKSVTVALSGDGADELLGGYPNFIAQKFARLMANIPPTAGAATRMLLHRLPHTSRYMNLNFKLRQLSYGFGHPTPLQSYHWMSALAFSEQALLFQDNQLASRALHQLENDIQQNLDKTAITNPQQQLFHLLTTTYLPDNILMKTDRASMYNSLEVRAPYLSRAFAEYTFNLNNKLKIESFQGKSILKKMAGNYLPSEIIYRKKHGFGLPISNMIRGVFKDRFEAVLLSSNCLSDNFVKGQIKRYWDEHQQLSHDHGKKLYVLYRLFVLAEGIKKLPQYQL